MSADYLVEAIEVRRYMVNVTQAASAAEAQATLQWRLNTMDPSVELGRPAEVSIEVGAAYETLINSR